MTASAGNLLTVDELVALVETMRQAQVRFFEISNDRTGKYQPHQRTRALQAAKVAETRVDAWLVLYREEVRRLEKWEESVRTDELKGLYNVERDR